QLHRLVGDALEDLYPDRLGELSGVLALHYEQAGETDRAIQYLDAAGHYALERNAIVEAFDAFDRAYKLLPKPGAADDPARRRRWVEIALGRTQAGYSFRKTEDTIGDLQEVGPVVDGLDDPEL